MKSSRENWKEKKDRERSCTMRDIFREEDIIAVAPCSNKTKQKKNKDDRMRERERENERKRERKRDRANEREINQNSIIIQYYNRALMLFNKN